jgi:hypothetical protein
MYADMASELARLKVDDLLREGCRLRRYRRTAGSPVTEQARGGRVGCLPVEGQA